MSRRKLSFTEKRRASLAMKWDRIERLESKNTITEPISVTALSLTAFRGLAQLGIMRADGDNSELLTFARLSRQANQGQTLVQKAPAAPPYTSPIGFVSAAAPSKRRGRRRRRGGRDRPSFERQEDQPADVRPLTSTAGSNPSQSHGISTPWKPASGTAGGAAMAPRGGSGNNWCQFYFRGKQLVSVLFPGKQLVSVLFPGRNLN